MHYRNRSGRPALRWLAKHDPEAALAVLEAIRDATLQTHQNAIASRQLDPRERSADDMETHSVPDAPVSAETLTEPVQDGPDDITPEMLHEVRPTEREVCMALGWIEWPRTGRSAPIGWAMRCQCGLLSPAEGRHVRPSCEGTLATLAGMTFNFHPDAFRPAGGTMVSYTDARGNERQPLYVARKPRGGKRPHRTTAAASAYLARPAAVASPLHAVAHEQPLSGERIIPPMLDPLPREAPSLHDMHGRYGVEEARAELRAMGVDGSVQFERLPFPATKCPTGIAKNARFIGGIVGRKLTASVPPPSWQEREPTSLSTALEEVASRGTLADIGRVAGDNTSRPDRAGKRILVAEARALLAANDNADTRVAA